MDPLCYLCFRFVFIMRSCLFLAALCLPDPLSLVCDNLLCFCHFPIWCLGSGVVLDCIDS